MICLCLCVQGGREKLIERLQETNKTVKLADWIILHCFGTFIVLHFCSSNFQD